MPHGELPQKIEAYVAPSTVAVLRLISEASGVGPETIAASVLDKFAEHYSGLLIASNPMVSKADIDEAAQNIDPQDL